MRVEIKRASVGQIDKIMDWRMEVLAEVFSEWNKENQEEIYQANFQYYSSMLPKEQHIAVFADKGNETIGCGGVCIYREMPSPDNPNGLCAYLMNIYVRKEHRGQGVANKIVSYLIHCAKGLGANKIFLETSECGRKLYENLGFADMINYMKLSE